MFATSSPPHNSSSRRRRKKCPTLKVSILHLNHITCIHSYRATPYSPFPPSSNLTSLYSPDVISQTFAYIYLEIRIYIQRVTCRTVTGGSIHHVPLQQNNIHMAKRFCRREVYMPLLIILHCPWL